MLRKIITIDEDKCTGCGLCVPECKEGALQIIEGKARLVGDLFCDGLGACLGTCPEGAITVEEREAEPYDERSVIELLRKKPVSVLKAHLEHLLAHNAMEYYHQAVEAMAEFGISNPTETPRVEAKPMHHHHGQHLGGCPGMQTIDRRQQQAPQQTAPTGRRAQSALQQWPVQLHLVSPAAPYFRDTELLVMSTCGPIASAEIHEKYLPGRAVVVACPKLDITDPYVEKLAEIIRQNNTPKVLVAIMEVPCCKGLSKMVLEAARASGVQGLEIEEHIISLEGKLKQINYLEY